MPLSKSGGTLYRKRSVVIGTDIDISGLDIAGESDIGEALVDADLIIVDNGAGGTITKSEVSRIPTYTFTKVSGDVAIASNGAATIQANAVALGTDTTGNYISTIAGTSNEITVSGSGSETATVTIGLPDDVTIAGDLTVSGTTTTIESTTVTVDDPMFALADNNSGDAVDIGWYGKYVDSGTKYSGLVRDASDSDMWKLFATTGNSHEAPSTTVNTTSGFTLANLSVNELTGTLATASQTNITGLGTVSTGTWEATDVGVAHGGTGVSTLLTNAVLTGNGTSAIQAETDLLFSSNKLIPTAAAHDAAGTTLTISAGATTAGTSNNQAGGALTFQGGQGKGSGAGGAIIFQVANEAGSGSSLNSLATALTINDDGTLATVGAIELGHATDTTIARSGSGDITIEGNAVYRAGGTDVAIADGGTGAGTATAGFDALSPMTAEGDVLYGGSSGTVTKLAKGDDGEFLKLASGVPTWGTVSAGTSTGLDATSSSANLPVAKITNTHADATAGYLKFIKDPGSGQGADGDVLGTVTFFGTDASNNAPEELARMESSIVEADHGSEAGAIKFYVAENDATMTAGLQILGQATDDGEIDVTIGAGAASTTTIAGTLTMGSTAAMTNAGLVSVANQSGITGLGTIATGTWEATDVAVAHGGTGASSLTDNAVLTGTGTSAITAESTLAFTGDVLSASSTSADLPMIELTNTHAGATAGKIRFSKDSGSGDDNDVMGTIEFFGTDAAENTHERLAYIDSYIIDSAHGSEAAGLRFYVAENDATNTLGLQILGQPDDNGEVDVTIGAGAASTTTIAGTLTMGSTAAMTNAGLVSVANQSGITGVGTISSGTWEATDVGVAHGGTGVSTLLTNAVLTGNGTSAIQAESTLLFSSNKLIPTASAHDAAGTVLTMSAGATTAGTTNNIAGGALTFQGGQGKGSGAGGDIIFQTANAAGSGSSLNALATALTISDDLGSTFTGALTVGVDDTGHDVKLFGASAGAYMLYDQSEDQLVIMGASADATTSTGKLLLATSLPDINANDVIGKIEFQAPHEGDGTDAITVAAGIEAVAQGTFSASVNATDMIFKTGHSEAAAEKFRITSQGELGVGGANYGTDGQVLTSGGAGAAPAWEDAGGGASAGQALAFALIFGGS